MARDDTWLREELFHNLEHVAPFYNGSMHGGLRKSSSASFFSKVGHPLRIERSVAFHAGQLQESQCTAEALGKSLGVSFSSQVGHHRASCFCHI